MKKRSLKKLPPRKRATHKGDYGHVFVLAGSKGLTGAAYLTSQAALLSGSGLVTLGIPESLNPVMARKLTEVMTLPLAETEKATLSRKAHRRIKEFLKKRKIDALAVGPGLSQNASTVMLVRRLIAELKVPFVLDADGINAFAGNASLLKEIGAQAIITPHPGEMGRLLGRKISRAQKNRINVAKKFVNEYNNILVLKGYRTVVAAPGRHCYVNKTGNPGMASGGTGDVLTGIIASLIGQKMNPYEAAVLGVHVHGLAGDLAKKEKGERSLIATDLLKKLPEAFKKMTTG